MKKEDLEPLGLTKEQTEKILSMHNEEFDPVQKELDAAKEDLKNEKEKTAVQETTIKNLKKDLEEFKDVDVSGMNQKITDLEKDLREKEETHKKEIADRDFDDLLKGAISKENGINIKAIKALLDVETLRQSKNQKEDVAAAIKVLTEAEDSKMLFGKLEPNPIGTGNIIGQVQKPSTQQADTLKDAISAHYNIK